MFYNPEMEAQFPLTNATTEGFTPDLNFWRNRFTAALQQEQERQLLVALNTASYYGNDVPLYCADPYTDMPAATSSPYFHDVKIGGTSSRTHRARASSPMGTRASRMTAYRIKANLREKQRNGSMNEAYGKLSSLIPSLPSDKPSKFSILKQAQQYILFLTEMLNSGYLLDEAVDFEEIKRVFLVHKLALLHAEESEREEPEPQFRMRT